jgi:PleD family two-component response regulator
MTSHNYKPKFTVLIADDDPTMRLLIRRNLQKQGYEVIVAEDGEQSLQLYIENLPDLVLLDAMMPKYTGFEVCSELQKFPGARRAPVMMITWLNDEASVDKAFESGAIDYVTKPIHWAVLRQRVQRILTNRHLEKLRDDLIHMIVHDLKNPLSAISGYMEILQR